MTLADFNRLSFDEQVEVVWEQGIQLGERQKPPYEILLYGIGAFYVEMYVHSVRRRVIGLKGFENMARLDPYLEAIDLTELLSGVG